MLGRTILRWLHLALAALRRLVDRALAVVERELPEAPPVAFEPADEPPARSDPPSGPPEHWLRMVRERAPHLLRDEGGEATRRWAADRVPPSAPPTGTPAGTPRQPGGPPASEPSAEPTSAPARPRRSSWADAGPYRTRHFRPPPGRRGATPPALDPGATDAPDGHETAIPHRNARHGAEAPAAERPTGRLRPYRVAADVSPAPRASRERPDAAIEGDDGRVGDVADHDVDAQVALPRLTPAGLRDDESRSWTGGERTAGPPASAASQPAGTPPASSPWPSPGEGAYGPHADGRHGAVAPVWHERTPARHAGRADQPVAQPARDPWPELPPLDTPAETVARHVRATLELQERRERVRREQEGRLWSA